MATKQIDVLKTVERLLRGAPVAVSKTVKNTDLFPNEETYLEPVNPDLPAIPGELASPLELLQEIADNTRALKDKRNQQTKVRVQAYTVSATAVTSIPGNPGRSSLSLYNQGPDVVYLVRSYEVDTTQGMPIPVDAEREVKATAGLYLLSEGTSDVRTIEELA